MSHANDQNCRPLGNRHPQMGAYSPIGWSDWAVATFPLGAHFQDNDVTFAVYAKHATRILLEIYASPTGEDAQYDYWLEKNPADDIWRAKIANLPHGTFYGFRCWGPNWTFDHGWQRGNSQVGFRADVDMTGNRYNPNKVLFDPYAKELSHDRDNPALVAAGQDGGMYGTGPGDYRGIPRREFDTGPWAAKGIVLASDDQSSGSRPLLPPENSIIYEAHVRGLSKHRSASNLRTILQGIPGFEKVVNVPEQMRGTYAGAAYLAPYLKALGYTAIEFLPVQESDNDMNPNDRPGGNYWGYMTSGYFAPDRRYAHDQSPGGPTREFKQMVKAFHDAGVEVYLDVVFNHSGEGGNWGDHHTTGFVSLGGFDVREYYQLNSNNDLEQGATGCGNQFNFSRSAAQRLVIDSLTYWLVEMGVDGFRFDLAPVLGRTPDAFERNSWPQQRKFFKQHSLLEQIKQLGQQHRAEMIAEAWDLWGYEVGNFPAGWGEWNGRYRDSIRRFTKGDRNIQGFIDYLNGDYHHFNDQGGPQRSVNFVVAHDGFTLMDLVSYNAKNNRVAWPFGPSDGGNDNNDSWDSKGDHQLRRQRLRNFWAILFFSRGVPMTVWGDEFGRTQNGNNNPYNIDSVATWNNYEMIATNRPTAVPTGDGGAYHDNFGVAASDNHVNPLFRFANFVAGLRAEHPALRQRKYGDWLMDSGEDVTYQFKRPDGNWNLQPDDLALWLRIDGSEVGDNDFLVLINMNPQTASFNVPHRNAKRWVRLIDTAAWAESEHNCWRADAAQTIRENYRAHRYSVVILAEIDDR